MKNVAAVLGTFAVLVLGAFPGQLLAQREIINPPGASAPNPNAVLSNAIKIGNQIWVSGLTGSTQGDTVGDIEKETTATLDKVKATLQAGGFDMKDVVAVQ